jgi:hypothetical protein
MKPPRITAAVMAAAATRLAGTVVQFVEDNTLGAAVYRDRLAAFESIEDVEEQWADDGTVVVLVEPGRAMDLVREHGTAGKAAAIINAELRAEWTA